MIFYFSGTGNSLYAAKNISEAQGEVLISIAKEMDKSEARIEHTLRKGELLGFVYPVYAWGPPQIVLDFIKRLKLKGAAPYSFSLCTCGDEEGRTTHILQKALKKKGLQLDSSFTIQMPNNYILGFDVDPQDIVLSKLEMAEKKLRKINTIISKRESGISLTIPGKSPALKSALINPLFKHFAQNTKKFYTTDACTKCGLCEKVCPVHSITVKDKPVWGTACTQCLACLHLCPVRAVQYGKGTLTKGRYVHPELRNKFW